MMETWMNVLNIHYKLYIRVGLISWIWKVPVSLKMLSYSLCWLIFISNNDKIVFIHEHWVYIAVHTHTCALQELFSKLAKQNGKSSALSQWQPWQHLKSSTISMFIYQSNVSVLESKVTITFVFNNYFMCYVTLLIRKMISNTAKYI